METIPYVSRRSGTHKGMRDLGWSRSRNNRRRKQPEVWKKRKVWLDSAPELVVRIVRIGNGEFQVQVRRTQNGAVGWQPMLSMQSFSPLALAVELELAAEGDVVQFVYRAAKQFRDIVPWIPAPNHPKVYTVKDMMEQRLWDSHDNMRYNK